MTPAELLFSIPENNNQHKNFDSTADANGNNKDQLTNSLQQEQNDNKQHHQPTDMNKTFWVMKDNNVDENNIDQQNPKKNCDTNSLMVQSMYESSNDANQNKSSLNNGGGVAVTPSIPLCHVSNASSLK